MTSWFLDGFSHYFLAYPGLSQPSTDFIRPGVNFAYYLNSMFFGNHWEWYLLLNYAVRAGLVCVSVKLALEALLLPKRFCLLVGLMVLLSPAFSWQAMFFPSFTFDLLAALLVVLALHELWNGRYAFAWIFLAIAVFTKETALFAPVTVAVALWLPGQKSSSVVKRLAYSVLWILPLLTWVFVRHLAFHGKTAIYVLKSLTFHDQALSVLHGVLAWPFGTRGVHQAVYYRFLFFPLNAAFWLGFIYILISFLLRNQANIKAGDTISQQGTKPNIRPGVPLSVLLLFTTGAALMPVVLNLPQRFGASFYPLFFLVLVAFLYSTVNQTMRRGTVVAIVVTLIMAVYQKTIDPTTLLELRAEWTLARGYIWAIHSSGAQNLLIINDASGGFTSSEIIARFADFHGFLARSNNLDSLSIPNCAGQPQISSMSQGDRRRVVSYLTPSCGLYDFDGITPAMLEASKDGLVQRTNGQIGVQVFQPPLLPLAPSGVPALFGTLTIEVTGPSATRQILTPDLRKLLYREIR